MPEPVTSATATVKLLGLLAVVAFCIFMSWLVVIIMKTPRTAKEWAVSLASTIMVSLGMGSATLIYFDLAYLIDMPHPFIGWVVIGVIMFMWGLAGWFLVRLGFRTMHASEDDDFFEVARKVRGVVFGERGVRYNEYSGYDTRRDTDNDMYQDTDPFDPIANPLLDARDPRYRRVHPDELADTQTTPEQNSKRGDA